MLLQLGIHPSHTMSMSDQSGKFAGRFEK